MFIFIFFQLHSKQSVYLSSGSIAITDGLFLECRGQYGGAIYAENGGFSLSVSYSIFSKCISTAGKRMGVVSSQVSSDGVWFYGYSVNFNALCFRDMPSRSFCVQTSSNAQININLCYVRMSPSFWIVNAVANVNTFNCTQSNDSRFLIGWQHKYSHSKFINHKDVYGYVMYIVNCQHSTSTVSYGNIINGTASYAILSTQSSTVFFSHILISRSSGTLYKQWDGTGSISLTECYSDGSVSGISTAAIVHHQFSSKYWYCMYTDDFSASSQNKPSIALLLFLLNVVY